MGTTLGMILKTKGILKNRIPDINERFTNWTVLNNNPINISKNKFGMYAILCKCDCGTEKLVRINSLLSGKSKSCFCNYRERTRILNNFVGDLGNTYFNRIIKSAKIRNLEFNLTKEYIWNLFIKQNKKCALSGLDIKLYSSSRKSNVETTASLDRINSKIGYVEENIQWIHKDINKIKQNFDEDYLINLCHKIIKHNEYRK